MIVEHQVLLEPTAFARLLQRSEVTALITSTALFNLYAGLIPEALAGLRMVMCGGERADPASFRRVREHSSTVRLFNGYGPTEATTCASRYEVFDVLPGTLACRSASPTPTCASMCSMPGASRCRWAWSARCISAVPGSRWVT